jgi:hypothetical protein
MGAVHFLFRQPFATGLSRIGRSSLLFPKQFLRPVAERHRATRRRIRQQRQLPRFVHLRSHPQTPDE